MVKIRDYSSQDFALLIIDYVFNHAEVLKQFEILYPGKGEKAKHTILIGWAKDFADTMLDTKEIRHFNIDERLESFIKTKFIVRKLTS